MSAFVQFVRRHMAAVMLAFCVALSSLPFCWEGLPFIDGHDLVFHLERIESIARGISQGHVPVWLYQNQAYGYGYPTGVCYPSVFLYPFAALRMLGLSLQDAYRVFVLVVNAVTAALAYACLRRMFRERGVALACSVLWVLSPYRLVDVWLRAAVGEYLALAFVPLVAYGLWCICLSDGVGDVQAAVVPSLTGSNSAVGADMPESSYTAARLASKTRPHGGPTWLPLSLGMAGVVQSHVLSVVLLLLPGLPLVVVSLWVGSRTRSLRRMLASIAAATIVCVCLCANVIVPLFDYGLHENMFASVVAGWGIPAERALEPYQVVGAFWPFRGTSTTLAAGTANDMPTPVGCALALAFVAGILVLVRPRTRRALTCERRALLVALLVVAALLAFSTTRFFPWELYREQTPLGAFMRTVGVIQFPWRLIGPLCFVLVLVAGIVFGVLIDVREEDDVAADDIARAIPIDGNVRIIATTNRPEHVSRSGYGIACAMLCVALCLIEAVYDNMSFLFNAEQVAQSTIDAIGRHETWSIGFGEYLNANFDANARDTYDGLLASTDGLTIDGWTHDDVTAAELRVTNTSSSVVTITVPVLYNHYWQASATAAAREVGYDEAAAANTGVTASDVATTPELAEVDGYLAVRVPANFIGTINLAFVAPLTWYVAYAASIAAIIAVVVRATRSL